MFKLSDPVSALQSVYWNFIL